MIKEKWLEFVGEELLLFGEEERTFRESTTLQKLAVIIRNFHLRRLGGISEVWDKSHEFSQDFSQTSEYYLKRLTHQ